MHHLLSTKPAHAPSSPPPQPFFSLLVWDSAIFVGSLLAFLSCVIRPHTHAHTQPPHPRPTSPGNGIESLLIREDAYVWSGVFTEPRLSHIERRGNDSAQAPNNRGARCLFPLKWWVQTAGKNVKPMTQMIRGALPSLAALRSFGKPQGGLTWPGTRAHFSSPVSQT